MSQLSYTPVTLNTDTWIDPMRVQLYQIWAEVRGQENLVPIFPKLAFQAARNIYEVIKSQIRKGQEKDWGDVHLLPVEGEKSKLILPSNKSTDIEYLRAKFEREKRQLSYNKTNPFWK